jgi:dolichol-phosphate mannosyltransferase
VATEIITNIQTKSVGFPVSSVSVVIPVFNQQSEISYSLKKIKRAIESSFRNYDLIVVNDGSTDDTLSVLRSIASKDEHVCIISYTPNRGKGYAVKQGVLHSQGDAVVLIDGDLDISPYSIRAYIERLSISDLVIGSKRHPKSNVTIPKLRFFLSRAFNLLVKVALGIRQEDTQVGFKAGRGDIMRTMFRGISVKRYAFDVELFAMTSILHLKVQEMPVKMKISRQFTLKEILNMFVDVIRIWYRHKVLHVYEKELRSTFTSQT